MMKLFKNFFGKNKPGTPGGLLSDDSLNQSGDERVASTSLAVTDASHPIGCETLSSGQEPIIAE
jgi:hypothetical protein